MSNTYIDISAVTRPSDFVTKMIFLKTFQIPPFLFGFKINSSQHVKILLILKIMLLIIVETMVSMQLHPQELSSLLLKMLISTNTDVTLTDLSANTFYDLSAHLINEEDISNNKIVASGITRPTNL